MQLIIGVSNLVFTGLVCGIVFSFNYFFFLKSVFYVFQNLFDFLVPSVFLKFFCGIDNTFFYIHYYSFMGDACSMYKFDRVCLFYNRDYILDYQPEVIKYINYLNYSYYEYYQHYCLHMSLHPTEPFIARDYQTIHESRYLWFMNEKIKYNHY